MHLRPIHDPPEGPRVPVTPIVTRMQRLREATRVVHTRIEGVLPLLDPALTRARYTRVVEAFYGFYAPLEPCIARGPSSAKCIDGAGVRKTSSPAPHRAFTLPAPAVRTTRRRPRLDFGAVSVTSINGTGTALVHPPVRGSSKAASTSSSRSARAT